VAEWKANLQCLSDLCAYYTCTTQALFPLTEPASVYGLLESLLALIIQSETTVTYIFVSQVSMGLSLRRQGLAVDMQASSCLTSSSSI